MTSTAEPTPADHPWTTSIAACEEARCRGDRRVGTEHLVVALLADHEIVAVLGVTGDEARARLDELDGRAIEAVGVRASALDAPYLTPRPLPPRPTLAAVVRHRMPLTPVAKAARQEAGRPIRRGQRITAPQVLSVRLERRPPDPGAVLLGAFGVDGAEARNRLAGPPAA